LLLLGEVVSDPDAPMGGVEFTTSVLPDESVVAGAEALVESLVPDAEALVESVVPGAEALVESVVVDVEALVESVVVVEPADEGAGLLRRSTAACAAVSASSLALSADWIWASALTARCQVASVTAASWMALTSAARARFAFRCAC
jgi:hypothetical protein